MGGALDCRSAPGEGATFWIDVELPSAAAPQAEDPGSRDENETGLVGRRVLVTDDNATNRQVVGLILETVGIEPVFAENGREALQALSQQSFDLILMDMMMPEMDGVEATRRLRAGEAGPHARGIPLLMLTANTLPEHVAQSFAAGADGHLAKPVSPAGLLSAVAQALTEPLETALGKGVL
jgi:CheY-like chemotaxis protein